MVFLFDLRYASVFAVVKIYPFEALIQLLQFRGMGTEMKDADAVTVRELHCNIIKQDCLACTGETREALYGRCRNIFQDLFLDIPLLESQEIFLPQETVRIGQWRDQKFFFLKEVFDISQVRRTLTKQLLAEFLPFGGDQSSASCKTHQTIGAAHIGIEVHGLAERGQIKYLNALYPESFDKLTQLERSLYDGIDFNLLSLISEMDFYFEVSELIKKADRQNIPHTYPTPAENPSFSADELYDITLISAKAEKIVPNNVFISPENRCFYICGANGGGKTTYLRAVASQLIMFLGGCPIFCRSAMIYTYTKVFGHFPQDEDSAYYGRLDREINAVSEIIGKCDDESFVFLNETFSGGTQSKATELALSVMDQLSEKGSCCLFVTHLYDVYKSAYPVLSPVVANDLSHTRTYQIGLSDKPGGSYAGDILKKYDLDEKSLGDDS